MRLKLAIAAALVACLGAGLVTYAFPRSSFPMVWTFQCDPEEMVVRLAYTPDGATLIGLAGGGERGKRLIAWNAADGRELPQPAADIKIGLMAVDPTGNRLAITSGNHVVLWDVATNRELKRIEFEQRVASAEYSGDGKRLVVELGDSTKPDSVLVVHDLADGKTLHSQPAYHAHGSLSPDGKTLVVSTYNPQDVVAIDIESGDTIRSISGRSSGFMRFLPDGRNVLLMLRDDTLTRWNLDDGVETELTQAAWLDRLKNEGFATSPDGGLVAVSGGAIIDCPWTSQIMGKAIVLRTTDKRLLGTVFEGDRVGLTDRRFLFGVAVSPDGTRLATASSTGRVRTWSLPPK